MRRNETGVTRAVFIGKRYTVKGCWGMCGPVRGWLANRSEYKQRFRTDVNPPILSLFHFVAWYLTADYTGSNVEDVPSEKVYPWEVERRFVDTGDARKASSWGKFGTSWLLIDFDQAWQCPRGIIGAIYYWRQERMARKWASLPMSDGESSGETDSVATTVSDASSTFTIRTSRSTM